MRLTELNPRFIGAGGEDVTVTTTGAAVPRREGVAITLDCPCKREQCKDNPLTVLFANPVEGDEPFDGGRGWRRTGETFDTLTLVPSIQRRITCDWHGFITDGEVITC